jgi:hypothetical protein
MRYIFFALLLPLQVFADGQGDWFTVNLDQIDSKSAASVVGYLPIYIEKDEKIDTYVIKTDAFAKSGQLTCKSVLPVYRSGYQYEQSQACMGQEVIPSGNDGLVWVLDKKGDYLLLLTDPIKGGSAWIKMPVNAKTGEFIPVEKMFSGSPRSYGKTFMIGECVTFPWRPNDGKITLFAGSDGKKMVTTIAITPAENTAYRALEFQNGFVRVGGPGVKGWIKLRDPKGRVNLHPRNCSDAEY